MKIDIHFKSLSHNYLFNSFETWRGRDSFGAHTPAIWTEPSSPSKMFPAFTSLRTSRQRDSSQYVGQYGSQVDEPPLAPPPRRHTINDLDIQEVNSTQMDWHRKKDGTQNAERMGLDYFNIFIRKQIIILPSWFPACGYQWICPPGVYLCICPPGVYLCICPCLCR